MLVIQEKDIMGDDSRSVIAVNKVITFTPSKNKVERVEEPAYVIPPLADEAPAAATAAYGKRVWITGNLAFEAGLYFPQILVHAEGDAALGEQGLSLLSQRGFAGSGWNVIQGGSNAKVRVTHGTPSARQAFIALAQILPEASRRTGLSFGLPC